MAGPAWAARSCRRPSRIPFPGRPAPYVNRVLPHSAVPVDVRTADTAERLLRQHEEEEIVQTPTQVVILNEIVHDARASRVGWHLPPSGRGWNTTRSAAGKGDTLVVFGL